MRCLIAVPLLLLAANAFHLRAEDADEVRERGIAALKDSQANPHAIVDAARLFVKAAELYNAAGDEEKNVEMNSFLYWCKKKMTLEDIDAFTKGGEAAVASKLAAVEKARPKADDAQKWFDRADLFATKHPSEHLLIAIRFYEVADRFKGSDASLAAQDRSLKEQLLDKSNAVKTAAQPAAVKPADPAAKDLGKRPVPLADDIKMAEKLIKDLLKADFAKTDAASRLALVAKLLQQAEENKNDAASYYVLLHEARDLAVLAGDASKAAEVQNQMRDAFKQDFAAILLDLRKLEPSAKAADPAAALAGLFLLSAEDALAVENYDQAVRFNSHADDLLPLIKDAALKTRLKTEIPRVQALKRESVAALAAQKTLATKPDDAEANLVAGKFALLLGEVEKSMALLAKSKDAVLSGLAKSELSPPKEGTEQAKLADGWFDRAEKEGSAFLKSRMQERAEFWYTSALPGLTGIPKLKVEGRMKGPLGTKISAGAAPSVPNGTSAKSVNILKLVDVTKDVVKGNWKMEDDGALNGSGTIQFPYVPGSEYDLNVSFTPRKYDDNGVGFILVKNDSQFLVSFGAWYNKHSAISFINGKWGNLNDTKTNFSLQNGQKYFASIKVRKQIVSVWVDGKLLFEHKSDGSDFTIIDDWRLNSNTAIGMLNGRTCSFDRIDIIDMSRKGPAGENR